MTKKIGSILVLGGLIALIYTGINYINNTDSFGFLGADVVVSKGDLTGLVIAAAVMILGFILQRAGS